MSLEQLIQFGKELNYDEQNRVETEEKRLEFIEKFPLDGIEGLTPDQYVVGNKNKDTFCYWLEYRDVLFGVGGGSAAKFGLYYQQNQYHINSKETVPEGTLQQYFKLLKENLTTALQYVSDHQIEKISELKIPIWPMILQKILSIYYPDQFLTIGKLDVLQACMRDIGFDQLDKYKNNLYYLNHLCRKQLASISPFSEWGYDQLSRLVWDYYHRMPERNYYIIGSKYGENAEIDMFPDMKKYGAIGVKFAEEINLSSLVGKKHLEITGNLKGKGVSRAAYNTLKYFLNLKPGDYIAIKASGSPKKKEPFLSIIALAKVVEKNGSVYQYAPENPLKHMVHIQFLNDSFNKEFSIGGYGQTIHKLDYQNKQEYVHQIFYDHNSMNRKTKTVVPFIPIEHPLNTILYGPPGTGKTYHTIQRAAEIANNGKIDDYSKALEIFNQQLGDQIELITFHQNYSYEDFIQGLRPDVKNGDQLRFERRDGVFKEIADRARENLDESQNLNQKRSFQEVFNDFMKPLIEGDQDEIKIDMKRASYFITDLSNKTIRFRKANGKDNHTLSVDTLRRMYLKESTLEIQGLSAYYQPLLDQLLKKGREVDGTFVRQKNYVIIIDEINRANISRVFGELITLIEPDKRSHGAIPLKVTLPSGEPFTVPSNLYIIGTMNTADKSIALLDIALRRRFEFEAIYPVYDLPGSEIHDVEVLKKINTEIIKRKGYDFQIGHAYFMGACDLVSRMNRKVIPLLLEYFMNDDEEVAEILKAAELKIVKNKWPLQIEG